MSAGILARTLPLLVTMGREHPPSRRSRFRQEHQLWRNPRNATFPDPKPPHAQVRSLAPRAGLLTRTESAPCRSSIESSTACASRSFSARTSHPRIDAAGSLPRSASLLLLKNLLLSREPLYGVGEWAARHAPEALGFADTQLPSLNDDRVGRCLDRLFRRDIPSLALALGDPRGPRVRRRPRRVAQRLHHDHLPRRLCRRRRGSEAGRANAAGDHLGPQQGPSARPQATALHPHRLPRRRRAGVLPGRERQRGRRPRPTAPPGTCSVA